MNRTREKKIATSGKGVRVTGPTYSTKGNKPVNIDHHSTPAMIVAHGDHLQKEREKEFGNYLTNLRKQKERKIARKTAKKILNTTSPMYKIDRTE